MRRISLLACGTLLVGVMGLVFVSHHAANQRLIENRARSRLKELRAHSREITSVVDFPCIAPDSAVYPYIARFLIRRRIVEIDFNGQPADDNDLSLVTHAFPKFEQIDVSSTRITDRSLHQIGTRTKLSVLEARNTAITDAGIHELSGHSLLALVELDQTRITDAALADLANCPRLSRISVARTRVTDAGIAQLQHNGLRVLNVADTDVTAAGVAAFRAANPECIVVW